MKTTRSGLSAGALAAFGLSLAILPWNPVAAASSGEAQGSNGGPPETEVLVITGTRSPRTAALVPSSVTILSRDDIAAPLSANVSELLRSVSGLHLQQNGARGGNASLYLRGLDPNHVLVMVDGIRLNDPNNSRGGSFDPTTLSNLDIERIEIVRGPLSATYGSDALAGAINVITRRTAPDDAPSFSLDTAGGRFGTGHVHGRASSGLGWAGLSVAGGFDANGDPHSEGGYRGANLKASLDAILPGEFELRADLRFADAQAMAFPESSGGSELAVIRELETRDTQQLSAALTGNKQANDWLDFELRVSHFLSREDVDSPGVAESFTGSMNGVPPTQSSSDLHRTKLSLHGTATPLTGLRVTTGSDIQWEDGKSQTVYDFGAPVQAGFSLERLILGWFLEGSYDLNSGLSLSASLRADFSDGLRAEWSPSVGAAWIVPETPLTLYGSWGEGFKLPSFFALGNGLVGNSALRPERSQGWEAGVRGRFWDGRVFTRFAYFDIQVDNLIDFDPAAFRLVNRDRLLSRGVEFELDIELRPGLLVGGSTTFNPTDLVDSQVDLRSRPRWRGELHLDARPHPNVAIGVRALFVGSVKATSNPTGFQAVELAAWQRVDVTAAWTPREGIRIVLSIENLLDAEYSEAVGFPAVGIYPRAGVELSF